MTLDRYGDEADSRKCRDPRCGNGCPKGWIGYDDEHRPIPCLICKDHLLKGLADKNDYAERVPSARAQRAIESEGGE